MPDFLTYEQALEVALLYNPLLHQAEARSNSATQQVKQVLSSRRPKVSALADARYEENIVGGPFGGVDNERWNAEVRLDVPLSSSGRFSAKRTQAETRAQAADQSLRNVKSRVIHAVKKAYLRATLATRIVTVQEESLRVLKEQYENSTARFEAGILARLPLLQAQVAYENAKPALLRAQQNRRLALEGLRASMGISYAKGHGPDDSAVEEKWPTINPPPASLEAALILAEKQHSELAALDFEIMAAQASQLLEKRSNRPDLDGYFRYGVDNNTFEEDEDIRTGWVTGLTFTWTLIDLGARKSRLKKARFLKEELQHQRQALWLNIEQQLREAWYAKGLSEAILTSAELNVSQAKEALKLSSESLNNGRATQLDVLQAALALTQARLEQHTAKHDRLAAHADMVHAMGNAL